MNTNLLVELFGYLGSILVVISMLMTSVMRLRIINTIGSVIFAIYALIIRSYPTALMNFFLVGINIYQMIRLTNKKNNYSLAEAGVNDGYLNYLLNYFRDDIRTFFPEFEEQRTNADTAFLVCLDSEAVGIMMGKRKDSTIDLYLDYSIPAYRDCSVGSFLYPELKKHGITTITYSGNNPAHADYVTKMGFAKEENGVYTLKL